MRLSKCSIKTMPSFAFGSARRMRSLIEGKYYSCKHIVTREIGQDYDKDGKPLRIVRCQRCGLLMREYLADFTGEEMSCNQLLKVK